MRPLLLVILAFSLAACDSSSDEWPFSGSEIDAAAGVEVDAAALADLRAAWIEDQPAGYWLRYETLCFCIPTVTDVRVIGGEIAEVRINGKLPPDDPAFAAFTMLDLYDAAVAAYANADAATARTRPGSPPLLVSLSVDSVREIADEEVSYVVRAYASLDVAAQ